MAKHYGPSSDDHLDPIGRGEVEQFKTCPGCDGEGRIYAVTCEDCGGFCDVIKDGAKRNETKIIGGREIKLEYAEAVCQDCEAKGCWLFDWYKCDECNGKGYL